MRTLRTIITAFILSLILMGCEKEEEKEMEDSVEGSEGTGDMDQDTSEYIYSAEVHYKWTYLTLGGSSVVSDETDVLKTIVKREKKHILKETLIRQRNVTQHNIEAMNSINPPPAQNLANDGLCISYFKDAIGEAECCQCSPYGDGSNRGRYITYYHRHGDIKKEKK